MDGRHQVSEVSPLVRTHEHYKLQLVNQHQQQRLQQGQQQRLPGQHHWRNRPSYERRQQHQNRVQQTRCRAHLFRQHPEEKRGNSEAGLQFRFERKYPQAFHKRRSSVEKVAEMIATKPRSKLFARSRSTPWSLDDIDQAKAVQGGLKRVPPVDTCAQASLQENTVAGYERRKGGPPAAARLRRLRSCGSVDGSTTCFQRNIVQSSGSNRRYFRCTSQSTHKRSCATGSGPHGNRRLSNKSAIPSDRGSTGCSHGAPKGTPGGSQLCRFYKKSVSFDCTSNQQPKREVCNLRKENGAWKASLQASSLQEEYISGRLEKQLLAIEGNEFSIAEKQESRCASMVRYGQSDSVSSDASPAEAQSSSEFSPACSMQQAPEPQLSQQQKRVHRHDSQGQALLQQQQTEHSQPLHEQQLTDRDETAVVSSLVTECASGLILRSEGVATKQALLQKRSCFSQEGSPQNSPRNGDNRSHSPSDWGWPAASQHWQKRLQHVKQRCPQKHRPREHPVTKDVQPAVHRKTDFSTLVCPLLQCHPSPLVLYGPQVQPLQAGSLDCHKKEIDPRPDCIPPRRLLQVSDSFILSSPKNYSGSARTQSPLHRRIKADQRTPAQNIREALDIQMRFASTTTCSLNNSPAPQNSASPSTSFASPANTGHACSGDIMGKQQQGASLFAYDSPPVSLPIAALCRSPVCAADAVTSSASYFGAHAVNLIERTTAAAAEEVCRTPAMHVGSRNRVAAVSERAHPSEDGLVPMREPPLLLQQKQQHVGHSAPEVSSGYAGRACASKSGSDTCVTESASTFAPPAKASEPFSPAATADYSGAFAPSPRHPPTADACTTADAIRLPSDRASDKQTGKAASPHLPACIQGFVASAAACNSSRTIAARSDHAELNSFADEKECSQPVNRVCTSCRRGSGPKCVSQNQAVPSSFVLAFPPRDRSLMLSPGAPLVANDGGTTDGGLDNKEHDYIARQYEFIFPDHLLAMTAPRVTSACFPPSEDNTASVLSSAGVVPLATSASAPTAGTAVPSSVAAGFTSCGAALPDPAEQPDESAVDLAAPHAGLKSSAYSVQQSNVCPAAAPDITRGGSAGAAAVNAGVVSTVNAAGELPRPLPNQHEGSSFTGSSVSSCQEPGTPSNQRRSCFPARALFAEERPVVTYDGVNVPHVERSQAVNGGFERSGHSGECFCAGKGPRRGHWQKVNVGTGVERPGSLNGETVTVTRSNKHTAAGLVEEDCMENRLVAAALVADKYTEKNGASLRRKGQQKESLPTDAAVGSMVERRRVGVDLRGCTLLRGSVLGGRHETASACTALSAGTGQVIVEKSRKKEGEDGKGQGSADAANECATAHLNDLQARRSGLGTCVTAAEAAQRLRKTTKTTETLDLHRRAQTLPARSTICSRREKDGGGVVGRDVHECLARNAPATAILAATHQRSQGKRWREWRELLPGCEWTSGGVNERVHESHASPFLHSYQRRYDVQHKDTQATVQPQRGCVRDGGEEAEPSKLHQTASERTAAGAVFEKKAGWKEVIEKKAGWNEVREAEDCSESKWKLRQAGPYCTLDKNFPSEQEARSDLCGAATLSCEISSCSPGGSMEHSGIKNRGQSTSTSCSGGRRRLHYYQVLRLLGRGTFGHVYECLQYDAYTGDAVAAVAVKMVKKDEAYTRSAMQEIAILRQLNGSSCAPTCRYTCTGDAAGNKQGNGRSTNYVLADEGKTGLISGGRWAHSDEKRRSQKHQDTAGQQPHHSGKPDQESTRERPEADVDLGKRRVVQLLDDFTYCGHTCLVFELLQADLYQVLKKYQFSGFPLAAVKQVCRELLQGLAHLARARVVHCDLKPENILVRFSGLLPAQRQQQQSLLLQLPEQQYCSQQRACFAAEGREQQRYTTVNVSPAMRSEPSKNSTASAVSACHTDLRVKNDGLQGAAVCCGSSRRVSSGDPASIVESAGEAFEKALVLFTTPQLPSEVSSASTEQAEPPPCPDDNGPNSSNDNSLLPSLQHSGPCRAEGSLLLAPLRSNGSFTCNTPLLCGRPVSCVTPVLANQPVVTRAAAQLNNVSSRCLLAAKRSGHSNATDTKSGIPSTACRESCRAADISQLGCAALPTASASTSSQDLKELQSAWHSARDTAEAHGLPAAGAISLATRLSISIKVVDFSSAYSLPPAPQPASPEAVEVLEQGHALRAAAPYLYAQSRFYGAPEVMLGVRYMEKLDIWAVGCIAAELYSGKPLLPGATDFDQMRRLVALRGTPPDWMLRLGRRTSLYFVRDKPQPQQQPHQKKAEEEEQQRRHRKDEEIRQAEQHAQTRRHRRHNDMNVELQVEQLQQHVRQRLQQPNQRQLNEGVLGRKDGAHECKVADGKEMPKRRVCAEEPEYQQESLWLGKKRHGKMPLPEGPEQMNLLNRSCAVAAVPAAACALLRAERWGALSADPGRLPRQRNQTWWHRIRIAVSLCSILEKKTQQNTHRGERPPARQQLQHASASAQQPQQAGLTENKIPQGKQQAHLADAGEAAVRAKDESEKRYQAAALRSNQQQQDSQYAARRSDTQELGSLPEMRQRQLRAVLTPVGGRQHAPVSGVFGHSREYPEQTSATTTRVETGKRLNRNGTSELRLRKCEKADGRGETASGKEGEDKRGENLVCSGPEAGKRLQEDAEKGGLNNGGARKSEKAPCSNEATHMICPPPAEADAASAWLEREEAAEARNLPKRLDRCGFAEGSGWRLMTEEEAGEGTSREGIPRGGHVLTSLQELVTMRKLREQLCRLQIQHRETEHSRDAHGPVQVHIPGCCWPTANEHILCGLSEMYAQAASMASILQFHSVEDANRHSAALKETCAQSCAVPRALVNPTEEAREAVCVESKTVPSQLHTVPGTPRRKRPARKNPCTLLSPCVKGINPETLVRNKSFPQDLRSVTPCMLCCVATGGKSPATGVRNDLQQHKILNSAAPHSEGATGTQEGSGTSENTGRYAVAAEATAGRGHRSVTRTGVVRDFFWSQSQLHQDAPNAQENTDAAAGESSCHAIIPAAPAEDPEGGRGGRAADAASSFTCASASPPFQVHEDTAVLNQAAAAEGVRPTTLPQVAAGVRHSLPKRASRFFKKLMKGRTSRPSSSNSIVLAYAKNHSAASRPQDASTYNQESTSAPRERSSVSSASFPPVLSLSSYTSSAPTFERPSAPRSSQSCSPFVGMLPVLQQKSGSDGTTLEPSFSQFKPPSGAPAFCVSPAAPSVSATLTTFPHAASDSSSLHSSSIMGTSVAVMRTSPPLAQPCALPCVAAALCCFPAAGTMASPTSSSTGFAASSATNSATICSILPTQESFDPKAATPIPLHDAVGTLQHATPFGSWVASTAAPSNPSDLAATAFPSTATPVSTPSSCAVAAGSPCTAVFRPCPKKGTDDAGAALPLRSSCSCSAVVRVRSSSCPPFPPSVYRLRKETSTTSTVSSTTACSCVSLLHVDAAAADSPVVTHVSATGPALQKPEETETPAEVNASAASAEVLDPAAFVGQAEEERQEQLFLDFLDGMLKIDPFKRLSVEEALRHPFIAEDYAVVPCVEAGASENAAARVAAAGATAYQYAVTEAPPCAARGHIQNVASPQVAPASLPMARSINAAAGTGAAARAGKVSFQQGKTGALQQMQHHDPPSTKSDASQLPDVAAIDISATPAARATGVAAAIHIRATTPSAAVSACSNSQQTPLPRETSQKQTTSSKAGETAPQSLAELTASTRGTCGTAPSCAALCRGWQRCFPKIAEDAATLSCLTCQPATTVAVADATDAPIRDTATPAAAVASVGINGTKADMIAGVGAAATPAAAAAAWQTPFCFASGRDAPSLALLRERAVDEQYCIWSRWHFKNAVQRLRDVAAAHQRLTVVTERREQARVAHTHKAAAPDDARQTQQQSSRQRPAVGTECRLGEEFQCVACEEADVQLMRAHQEQQRHIRTPDQKSTKEEGNAILLNVKSYHGQDSISNVCTSLQQKCAVLGGPSGPPLTQKDAHIQRDAFSPQCNEGLTLTGGVNPQQTCPAEAKGGITAPTGAIREDTESRHNSTNCSAEPAKMQLQDKMLLRHVHYVLQEEALKATHAKEQRELRQKQLKELQELRRKRQLTFPMNLVPRRRNNFSSFFRRAPAGA